MATQEDRSLAPFIDAIEAVQRAIVSELAVSDPKMRVKLAQLAADDIHQRTSDLKNNEARQIMMLIVARICGVPIGTMLDQ